tara:strand:+ start:174 stop:488 length:315 start_codon:yes stop_codon:yes gene_type:complete
MLKPKKKKRVLKTKSSSYRYLSSAGSPETGAKLSKTKTRTKYNKDGSVKKSKTVTKNRDIKINAGSKNKDNFKKVVTKTKKGTTKKKVKTRKSPQFRKRATLIS